MELIWDHCFYDQLRTNPEEHPVMLTEAVNNPKNNREKMAEIMFEKYGVPGLFISMQALLSLYACGRTSGLVVDIGDGVTHTATVFNGWLLPHSSLRMNLAGRDLTERMVRLLAERGYQFTTTAEREIVRDIKEKLSYVAFNYEEELANEERDSIADDSYTLPDGQVIYVGSESFRCTEALFKPSLVGMEDSGIHELTYKSIFKCDNEIRKDMYANIVLSGGTTMTPGLQERLTKELSLLAPPDCTVNLYAPADRNNSVWIGGAVLASLDSFLPMWVTSTDYSERGFVAVHEKCNVIE
ncbi:actin-like [Zophobas morio]|uniref:actin-like n=1 Tax=Zophobas morio TaxID=2755281 RepID=UPI0030829D2A